MPGLKGPDRALDMGGLRAVEDAVRERKIWRTERGMRFRGEGLTEELRWTAGLEGSPGLR